MHTFVYVLPACIYFMSLVENQTSDHAEELFRYVV